MLRTTSAVFSVCGLLAMVTCGAPASAATPAATTAVLDCSQPRAMMLPHAADAAMPSPMPSGPRGVDAVYVAQMRMMREHMLAVARFEKACGMDAKLKADAEREADLLQSVLEDQRGIGGG